MVLSLLLNTIIIFINVITTPYTKNLPMRFMLPFFLLLLGYCCRCFCYRWTGGVEFRYKYRNKTAFVSSHSWIYFANGMQAGLILCMFDLPQYSLRCVALMFYCAAHSITEFLFIFSP